MYIYIQEIKTKTPVVGSHKRLEVIREERLINGEPKWVYGYKKSEERFERPIKLKYKVMAAHSYRDGNKVKKLSVSLGQFNYYDLLDGYPFECWGVEKRLKEKGIPYEGDVESLVYEKVNTIEDRILEELKQTEEYRTKEQIKDIELAYTDAKYDFKEQYGEDCYDCFYDVFGKLREPVLFEIYKQEAGKRQAERERQRKEQEEYERRSREEAYRRFFGGGYSGYQEQQDVGVSHSNFSQEELEIVRGIISAGYKKMAIKLHPDRGGDEKQMKLLNNIKDKLESIYQIDFISNVTFVQW